MMSPILAVRIRRRFTCLLLGMVAMHPVSAATNNTTGVIKPPVTAVTAPSDAASAGASAAAAASPAAAEGNAGDTVRVLVAAEQESVLAAQMAGRVDHLNVRLGTHIKPGEALLQFNCNEKEAYLKMARAEFYGARRTYESKVRLQATQSVSELEVAQAAASSEKFKAQIALYQAQLRQCTVYAPYPARVTKVHVKSFETVNAGQPLIDIVNDRKLKLQLNIPSSWLSRIAPKTRFSLKIDENGKSYDAQVTRINGKVDAVSQSVEIEGEVLGGTASLLPGMSGTARFASLGKR